jgi:hypothetical protein
MFKLGPGKNSADVYVTKLVSLMRTIAPGWCPGRPGTPLLGPNIACDFLTTGTEGTFGADVSSERESTSSSSLLCASSVLRNRFRSFGAVEDGVAGRVTSSSESESSGLARRAVRDVMPRVNIVSIQSSEVLSLWCWSSQNVPKDQT